MRRPARMVALVACVLAADAMIGPGSGSPANGADVGEPLSPCEEAFFRIHQAATGPENEILLEEYFGTSLLPPPYDELGPAEIPRPPELPAPLPEECLGPFETVFVVSGVPAVSGVYKSGPPPVATYFSDDSDTALGGFGNLRVTGAGIEVEDLGDDQFSAFLDMTPGRCFVGKEGDAFWTVGEAVHKSLLPRLRPDEVTFELTVVDWDIEEDANDLTSISVGVTAEGEPHMGVWRAVATAAESEVVYHYLPAGYRERVEIEWSSFRSPRGDNDWAGVASFSSVTYNDRDFMPWTGLSYQGSPQHDYQITLFCG